MLSREQLRGVMMVDTENLVTLAVAMGKAQEKDWLEGYESIGSVSAIFWWTDGWMAQKCRREGGKCLA